MSWLPSGKVGAVCFSVDDVHPVAASTSADRSDGVLARLRTLLERRPRLLATLFVTPDWRPAQLVAQRALARIPLLSEQVYHVALHPPGLLRLDRHPDFVAGLRDLPRTEIAPHGLHHVHRGALLAVEFQEQSRAHCVRLVRRSLDLFAAAQLRCANGFAPPGWNLTPALLAALEDLGFAYVSAARDIRTPIHSSATNAMSGLRGVSIVRPQTIGRGRIVHVPVNFQATSSLERAYQLVECGGLLSIKAHAFKHEGGHTMLDGLDDDYCARLDALFEKLERRYGDSLWWTNMSEIGAVFGRHSRTAECSTA